MPVQYTYCAYVAIPEIVRREFTVQEIKILKLCPPSTLPFRDPGNVANVGQVLLEPIRCVVCGIPFQRTLLVIERPFEKRTCGSVRCVEALQEWLLSARPITRKAKDQEDELLTFLGSSLYHLFRSKWLTRHRVQLED